MNKLEDKNLGMFFFQIRKEEIQEVCIQVFCYKICSLEKFSDRPKDVFLPFPVFTGKIR